MLVSRFDAFSAGACLFVAGVITAYTFEPGGWTRADTAAVLAVASLMAYGVRTLRSLYRSQRAAV